MGCPHQQQQGRRPVTRVFRDAMLPVILTMTADSKALRQTYGYHIDWDALTPAAA